jgi:hypothetical protein
MCRVYFATFACGHEFGNPNGKTFSCPDYLTCGPFKFVEHRIDEGCTSCIRGMRAIKASRELLEAAGFYIVDAERTEKVRRVLDLAARPDERTRLFFAVGVDPYTYMYDSANIYEFGGQLDDWDGPFIGTLTELIGRYILMPETPDLTENETRLFDQLRMAELEFNLMEREAETQLQEGASSRALLARLRTRMLPDPAPKDPNCPVCHEVMSGDSHRAIKLPCNHTVGLECMETWVGGWVPGYHESIFPFLCPVWC